MGYLLGVDGGATGTSAVLAELDGTVRAVATGGASNQIVVGESQMGKVFAEVIGSLLQQTGYAAKDCSLATFGLSALGNEADLQTYHRGIAPIGLDGELIIESDVVIAWASATEGQPGIGVIAGTGSSCFGVNKAGERYRALGWDYILADQGSGYWIGLQGLQAAFKAYDGRIHKTLLLDALVEHYSLESADQMLLRAYEPDFDKEQVASFAKAVSDCAHAGDPYAQSILIEAANELASTVVTVAKQLHMQHEAFPVGLIGGVFKSGDVVLKHLKNQIAVEVPHAEVRLAPFAGAFGALICGQAQTNTLTPAFIEQLRTTSAPFQTQLRSKK